MTNEMGNDYLNNSPVELETYAPNFEHLPFGKDGIWFKVPRNWLMKHIKKDYKNIEEFLDNYVWDETEVLYNTAKKEGVIIKED